MEIELTETEKDRIRRDVSLILSGNPEMSEIEAVLSVVDSVLRTRAAE